jgi:hypothetical protein
MVGLADKPGQDLATVIWGEGEGEGGEQETPFSSLLISNGKREVTSRGIIYSSQEDI